MVVLIRGGVDGPDIQNLLLVGIGKSLVGESQAAKDS